jgi:predicted DsbA family dithiol-disulfide isomerase
MEPAVPRFWFDYVDPWSFIMEVRLREAERKADVDAVRTAFELAPPPAPLLRIDEPSWSDRWDTAQREGRRMGLELTPPGSVPWTRKAHELALHARTCRRFAHVHDALLRAYHLDGRDIGRVDVLVEIGVRAGLDRAETHTVLGVDRHLAEVRTLRDSAEREGVRGVPTLSLGERRIEGLADVDRILELLLSR